MDSVLTLAIVTNTAVLATMHVAPLSIAMWVSVFAPQGSGCAGLLVSISTQATTIAVRAVTSVPRALVVQVVLAHVPTVASFAIAPASIPTVMSNTVEDATNHATQVKNAHKEHARKSAPPVKSIVRVVASISTPAMITVVHATTHAKTVSSVTQETVSAQADKSSVMGLASTPRAMQSTVELAVMPVALGIFVSWVFVERLVPLV